MCIKIWSSISTTGNPPFGCISPVWLSMRTLIFEMLFVIWFCIRIFPAIWTLFLIRFIDLDAPSLFLCFFYGPIEQHIDWLIAGFGNHFVELRNIYSKYGHWSSNNAFSRCNFSQHHAHRPSAPGDPRSAPTPRSRRSTSPPSWRKKRSAGRTWRPAHDSLVFHGWSLGEGSNVRVLM